MVGCEHSSTAVVISMDETIGRKMRRKKQAGDTPCEKKCRGAEYDCGVQSTTPSTRSARAHYLLFCD